MLAPDGTPTSTLVLEMTTKLGALTPFIVTPVELRRLVPVMVIVVPGPPEVGLNDEMVGVGLVKVSEEADVAIPAGVVTLIVPVEAPVGTVAEIDVGLETVNEAAAEVPNLTKVAPVKFVPVIVTDEPYQLLVGVNEEIVGRAGDTVTA